MGKEDKELLLKDICARLPYGVKAMDYEDEPPFTIDSYDKSDFIDDDNWIDSDGWNHNIAKTKPYLFPMSSMTEEQKKEYDSIVYHNIELHCERYYTVIDVDCYEELHDFYHKNHLDYRNLIGKGLAIDATGKNIY